MLLLTNSRERIHAYCGCRRRRGRWGIGAALAKAGADVTFIARGAHLAAMKSTGLKVTGPLGDTHLVPTQATDNPAEIGKVDIVLFCVKLWDVESAGMR